MILDLSEFEKISGLYKGKFRLDKGEVNVNIKAGESEPANETALRLNDSMMVLFTHYRKYLDHICTELLPNKNGDWLEEGESRLTEEEFKKNLQLYEINVLPDGNARLRFSDNGMFWGHVILLALLPDGSPDHATIEG